MAKRDLVGVVTVTYNSAGVLPDFLRCIAEQSHSNFLLFAIDNASTDQTIHILNECSDSRLRVIANPDNRGIAAGNNQGIRAALEAGCFTILLINNDIESDSELIRLLDEAIATHQVEMSCPKIMYYDAPDRIWAAGGKFEPWAGYRALHLGEGEVDRGQHDRARLVTYGPTCCVLIKKEVFDRVGLMDERYFVYSDDADFMYRAMKAGVKLIYRPEAKLFHKVGSLTGGAESAFQIQYGTRNRAYFLLKHFGAVAALPWLLIRAVYYFCQSLVARKGLKWLRMKEVSLWNALLMYAERPHDSRVSGTKV